MNATYAKELPIWTTVRSNHNIKLCFFRKLSFWHDYKHYCFFSMISGVIFVYARIFSNNQQSENCIPYWLLNLENLFPFFKSLHLLLCTSCLSNPDIFKEHKPFSVTIWINYLACFSECENFLLELCM